MQPPKLHLSCVDRL
jgi:hypothetical protein